MTLQTFLGLIHFLRLKELAYFTCNISVLSEHWLDLPLKAKQGGQFTSECNVGKAHTVCECTTLARHTQVPINC